MHIVHVYTNKHRNQWKRYRKKIKKFSNITYDWDKPVSRPIKIKRVISTNVES